MFGRLLTEPQHIDRFAAHNGKMEENTDVPTGPDADEPTTVIEGEPGFAAEPVPVATGPAAVDPNGPRLRDTVWGFKSMLLVAAGSLVIGGALGAALVAATNHDDGADRLRITSFQGGGDDQGGRGFGNRGQAPGLGNLTDEQRQKLEDFMQQRLQNFQNQNPQSPTTPAPTPSPSTAG
jgi:hypothetical protein